MHLVDVDGVSPPIIKLSDARHHASLLSNILLDNSLYFGVNEIISFQKLVGNLDKMTVANLGRQYQRSLNSYFKSFGEFLFFISYHVYCLNLLYMFLSSCCLCFCIPLTIQRLYAISHINKKTIPR